MLDTSEVAEQRYFELLSNQSPIERLAIALGLTQALRELATLAIANANPSADAGERRALLAERLYGRGIAERFFRRA